jgi:hypothetical protein
MVKPIYDVIQFPDFVFTEEFMTYIYKIRSYPSTRVQLKQALELTLDDEQYHWLLLISKFIEDLHLGYNHMRSENDRQKIINRIVRILVKTKNIYRINTSIFDSYRRDYLYSAILHREGYSSLSSQFVETEFLQTLWEKYFETVMELDEKSNYFYYFLTPKNYNES